MIFGLLKKYISEDIEIIVPLTYGSNVYKEKLIKCGKELFGKKIKFLVEHMDIIKFHNLIANIDIQIFAHNRQQALGNITIGLLNGTKIYLNHKVSTWGLLRKRLGVKVFSLFDLNHLSYFEFKSISNKEKNYNRSVILKWSDEKAQIESWRAVIDYNISNQNNSPL